MTPAPTSKHEARSQRAKHAQEERFISAIGVEGLKSMTYEEMGEILDISRERVRQIILANPALRSLRNERKERREQLAAMAMTSLGPLLEEGHSLEEAARMIGSSRDELESVATNDQSLWDFLRNCKSKVKQARVASNLTRLKEIADHAIDNQMTFHGACLAMGLDYDYMLGLRFDLGRDLAEEPKYRDLFNAELRIQREVAIARERILQGARLSECAHGLLTHVATIRRRLVGDTEVEAVLKSRRGFQKGSKE